MTTPIGIDLGTTFSCVAYVDEFKRVITCKNEQGDYTTPSMVAFRDNETIVGAGAKSQAALNASNTIYDIKRLIGKNMEDKMIKNDIKNWPFSVVDRSGKPMVEVECNKSRKAYHAEQISAYILEHLKSHAERMLNAKVSDAVITVPAAFNDSQRQATADAGRIAGLNVLRVINEPTAAAISFGFERKIADSQYILVYDLGGGTFDVSILKIMQGVYEVICTDGDSHLGGQDFDTILVEEIYRDIQETKKFDITNNPKAKSRIRDNCEKAKKALSGTGEYEIYIPNLVGDEDYEKTFTRIFFENACMHHFLKTIDVVKRCLSVAKLRPDDITHVVLAGGSSRIPKLKLMLEALFVGKELKISNNVDQSIAHGAAIQAAILKEQQFELVVKEVASNSLGLELMDERMFVFIEKNTFIPYSYTKEFSTAYDNQTKVDIKVFEGEEKETRKNRQLGQFSLSNITPAPKCTVKIKVTFSVDENGILQVSAREDRTGKERCIKIGDGRGRLSFDEIRQLSEEVRQKEAGR